MNRFFVSLFCLAFSLTTFAQPDTCGLRITLLTCSPGEELYATFGHTAIRVQDLRTGADEVYNYGMFEFGPDFYPKFIRGKLLYQLGIESYPEFIYTYQYESRSVVEQELQLGCLQKQNLWATLRENARPENRYYRYDFLFDNCTTRARDMILRQVTGAQVPDILPADKPSFRDMLHTYLDRGGQYWSKLGIDLLLGARIDRQVTAAEATFLPDYLMRAVDTATVQGRRLATPPQPVLTMPTPLNKTTPFRPAVVFGILLAVVAGLSLARKGQSFLRWFDRLFFFFLGLVGLLLLFMWLGTDHKVCRDNLNLLWALPTHAVAAWYAGRNTDRTLTYFKAVCWGSMLLLATWAFIPQQLNPAFIPLVVLIAVRSWFLSKPKAYAHKNFTAPGQHAVLPHTG